MRAMDTSRLADLTRLRHDLHKHPELSGKEHMTAARIAAELDALSPDRVWLGLGGHGVAAEFAGQAPGPTVLLRCELDALPIAEISDKPYRSAIPGMGHLCGHDGHMVSMLGVAMDLARQRPARGRVVVLFQPAEETGAGARDVIADPRWPDLRPDYAFAWHNVPGRPLGEIGLRSGPANCASRGMQVMLTGKSSHAAAPEDGQSPAPAMAHLMTRLPGLGVGSVGDADFAMCTLTHARLGAPSYGIAPADGELRATLRTMTNDAMDALIARAKAEIARARGALLVQIHWHDVFRSVTNDAQATGLARDVARGLGHAVHDMPAPMRWSEDFGRFGDDGARAAMLYIGSGTDQPQLHNPDFDFPDALLPVVIGQFLGMVDRLLGSADPAG